MRMHETEAPDPTAMTMDGARDQARRAASQARSLWRQGPAGPDADRVVGARRPPRWPWLAAAFDVVLLTGTPGLSDALDRVPLFQALATLGGYPRLVQVFALMSLIVLVVLAATTQGFRRLAPPHLGLLAVAGMLTVVAGAGWLLLLLLSPVVIVAVLVAKLLG